MRTLYLDDLNTYLYCGEYYRHYIDSELDPVETMDHGDQFVSALVKTVFLYKLEHGSFPTENEIINFIFVGLKYYEKYNLPGFFQDQITSIIRLIGSMIDMFKNHEILEAFNSYEYISNNVKLVYNSSFVILEKYGKKSLFILGNQSPRAYFKSIEYGLDLICITDRYSLDDFKANVKFISTKTKGDIILEFKALDYNIESAKYFLDSVLKSISLEIYKPIWRCQNISCPIYSICSVGNRL